MSRQLTVRLPDDLVAFIDARIEHGQASSRAAGGAAAIDRARRREIAARDAAILAGAGGDGDEFAALAAFAARTPSDHLA